MAIYGDDKHNFEMERKVSKKERLIDEISGIIKEFGSFTIADVEADHSPCLESKGKLVHLVEDFEEDGCRVYVYDTVGYSSEDIDTYDEDYYNFKKSELEYILELARQWVEINEDQ